MPCCRSRDELAKLIEDLRDSGNLVKKEEDSENSQDSVYTGECFFSFGVILLQDVNKMGESFLACRSCVSLDNLVEKSRCFLYGFRGIWRKSRCKDRNFTEGFQRRNQAMYQTGTGWRYC